MMPSGPRTKATPAATEMMSTTTGAPPMPGELIPLIDTEAAEVNRNAVDEQGERNGFGHGDTL
jgi:hypothetical protein